MSLERWGWTPALLDSFQTLADPGLDPGRIAREDRGRYLTLTELGERSAVLAGRLRHSASTGADLPAVGDWVGLRMGRSPGNPGGSGLARVEALLPRRTAFTRKAAGETTDEQIVAANIDTVFLVSGLDDDFNPRRIERYLTAAWESGANPVVVLNKADVASEVDERIARVEAVAPGVPVVAASALQGTGLIGLERWLIPGATVALLGSSGVGKSTLVNALLGADRQAVGGVRGGDSKGRHTTTRRELVPLPGGAILIDTPGMRELQLWGESDGLEGTFTDVEELSSACRFGDCRHRTEPGCAVREAIESGGIEEGRVEAWRKQLRELEHLERRRDARARADAKARWKQVAKSMKHHPKAHRWKT